MCYVKYTDHKTADGEIILMVPIHSVLYIIFKSSLYYSYSSDISPSAISNTSAYKASKQSIAAFT